MAKDTYYFSHDYNPTSDPKIQALIGEYGAIGYGLYWRIVEMLHEDENHELELKKYIFLALAKQMLTSVEQVQAIVNDCINVYELFSSEDGLFWSERVKRNIDKRSDLSKKRSIAGKLSAKTRKTATSVEQVLTNAEQVLTSVEQNSTNLNKGKEIKEKEIKENNSIINLSKSIGKELMTDEEKQLRFDTLKTELTNWSSWHESLCIATKRNRINVLSLINDFLNNIKADDDYYKDLTEIKKHCRNWINKQEKTNLNTNQPSIPAI